MLFSCSLWSFFPQQHPPIFQWTSSIFYAIFHSLFYIKNIKTRKRSCSFISSCSSSFNLTPKAYLLLSFLYFFCFHPIMVLKELKAKKKSLIYRMALKMNKSKNNQKSIVYSRSEREGEKERWRWQDQKMFAPHHLSYMSRDDGGKGMETKNFELFTNKCGTFGARKYGKEKERNLLKRFFTPNVTRWKSLRYLRG